MNKELSAAIDSLAESLRAAAYAVEQIRLALAEESTPTQSAEPTLPPKTYTLEEVRAVLLAKRKEGHRDEIKALLTAHGAQRLTDIDPEEFPVLMKEAEVIGN